MLKALLAFPTLVTYDGLVIDLRIIVVGIDVVIDIPEKDMILLLIENVPSCILEAVIWDKLDKDMILGIWM